VTSESNPLQIARPHLPSRGMITGAAQVGARQQMVSGTPKFARRFPGCLFKSAQMPGRLECNDTDDLCVEPRPGSPYKRSGSLVRPRHSTAMYTVGLVAPSAREAAEARLSERNRSIGMTVRKSGRKNARGRKGRRNKPSPHGDFPNAKSGSPDVILNLINSSLLEGRKECE